MVVNLLAAAALAVWIYLIAGRGGFWLASERDDGGPAPAAWPAVMAVIPARDEAEGVGETIASLLQQDYPGPFSIILVDDQSSDGTAEVARHAAAGGRGSADRRARRRAAGGVDGQTVGDEARRRARAASASPLYLLFTDADIVYDRRCAHAPRFTGAGERARAQFADGQHCAARASPSARLCRPSSFSSRCSTRSPG